MGPVEVQKKPGGKAGDGTVKSSMGPMMGQVGSYLTAHTVISVALQQQFAQDGNRVERGDERTRQRSKPARRV